MPKTTASFRFESDELERWKSAATVAGRNLTEWLRNAANDAIAPKPQEEPKASSATVDGNTAFERAACKDCGHVRHMHRGFGTCCQVLSCLCVGFDGVAVRPEYAQEVRQHSPGCKCDRCKPSKEAQ